MTQSFFRRFLMTCLLVAGFFACTKHDLPYTIDPIQPHYTVAKARAFYEANLSASRSGDVEGPLSPGEYTLYWERASVSLDTLLSSVDVPITLSRRYFHLQRIDSDSCYLQPIYPKLVVVKEHPLNLEGVYVRYYLPATIEMGNTPADFYDGLLNSHKKHGFSGMSIYTTLSGYPVCAVVYRDAKIQQSAFLYARERSKEENAALLDSLLSTVQLYRTVETSSRATGEDVDNTTDDAIGIEVVVVIGRQPEKFEEEEPDRPIPTPELKDEELWTGGAGGGGIPETPPQADQDTINTFKYNDKIKFTDERVEELLDSIFEDCMGKTLIMELGEVTILTEQNANSSNGSVINLKEHNKYGYRSYVLLEELFHCYQRQKDIHSVHPFPGIHYEIEAKVGWMMYLRRMGKELNDAQARAQVGHASYGIINLANGVWQKLNNLDQAYQMAYVDAIYYLRQMKQGALYTEEKYPQTEGVENWGLTNINVLSIDCE